MTAQEMWERFVKEKNIEEAEYHQIGQDMLKILKNSGIFIENRNEKNISKIN